MGLIKRKRVRDQFVEFCAKCGESLPGSNKCCDRAVESTYSGYKAVETRHTHGFIDAKPFGAQLSDGFNMTQFS